MDIRTPSMAVDASDVYTDLNSLNNIKNDKDSDSALKKVAQQFESLFVGELLKNMRSASEAFEEGGLFNSSESNTFRDMYDQQLSVSLAKKGLGLAEALYGQMHAQYGKKSVEAEGTPVGKLDNDSKQVLLRRAGLNPYSPLAEGGGALELPKSISTAPLITAQPVEIQLPENLDDIMESVMQPSAMDRMVKKSSAPEKTAFTDAQEFVDAILPKAKKAAEALGIHPMVLVAQSALETGWGKFMVGEGKGKHSHNLFNIKADTEWKGKKVGVSTVEFYNGVPIKENATFRAYDSFDESFNDFVQFLQNNPRYEKALSTAGNPEQFVKNLHKAGYATDPHYSAKVLSVYRQLVNGEGKTKIDAVKSESAKSESAQAMHFKALTSQDLPNKNRSVSNEIAQVELAKADTAQQVLLK